MGNKSTMQHVILLKYKRLLAHDDPSYCRLGHITQWETVISLCVTRTVKPVSTTSITEQEHYVNQFSQ